MLSQLIVGGDLQSRSEAIKPFLQSFQVCLDGTGVSLKIEDIRQLQHTLSLTSTTTQNQYHLILEAQALTLPAQHSLLKLLEEPPQNVQIILTADSQTSLLPTVLSRVQITHLDTPPQAFNDNVNQFLKLLSSPQISPLILLATDITKDNPQDFLRSLKHKLRSSLISQPTANRAKVLKLIQNSLGDLRTNINKELILSNLFIKVHSLTHS